MGENAREIFIRPADETDTDHVREKRQKGGAQGPRELASECKGGHGDCPSTSAISPQKNDGRPGRPRGHTGSGGGLFFTACFYCGKKSCNIKHTI